MRERGEEGPGTGAWLGIGGMVIAGGIGVLIVFALAGRAWYAWGFLGMWIFVGALALAFGYFYDRREQRRRRRLAA
jgi:hypothetical protein